MAKKAKLVLVLVEGTTDEDTFYEIMKRYNTKSAQIKCLVCRGDFAMMKGQTGKNVHKKLQEIIVDLLIKSGIHEARIEEIIQIVDLDGAFINDNKVIAKPEGKIEYTKENIMAKNVEHILDRNAQKRDVLGSLAKRKAIGKIPYSIYYMSTNLEVVLHNEYRHLTADQKWDLAEEFSGKYENDFNGFLEFINSADVGFHRSYEESWEHAQHEENGLMRGTNINLFFNRAEEELNRNNENTK